MNNPAKTFLKQYMALQAQYDSIKRDMAKRRECLTSISAPIGGDAVQSSSSDRMASVIASIIDSEVDLAETARQIEKTLREILEAIASVPDAMQKTVLTLRYVEGLDWIKVSERINYEISNTYIIHGRALVEVNKWMNAHNIVGNCSCQ